MKKDIGFYFQQRLRTTAPNLPRRRLAKPRVRDRRPMVRYPSEQTNQRMSLLGPKIENQKALVGDPNPPEHTETPVQKLALLKERKSRIKSSQITFPPPPCPPAAARSLASIHSLTLSAINRGVAAVKSSFSAGAILNVRFNLLCALSNKMLCPPSSKKLESGRISRSLGSLRISWKRVQILGKMSSWSAACWACCEADAEDEEGDVEEEEEEEESGYVRDKSMLRKAFRSTLPPMVTGREERNW